MLINNENEYYLNSKLKFDINKNSSFINRDDNFLLNKFNFDNIDYNKLFLLNIVLIWIFLGFLTFFILNSQRKSSIIDLKC